MLVQKEKHIIIGNIQVCHKKKMHQENKYTLMIHFPKNLTFLMSLSCLPFIYPIPPLSSFLNCISDESEKHPKQYMALIGLNHRWMGNKNLFFLEHPFVLEHIATTHIQSMGSNLSSVDSTLIWRMGVTRTKHLIEFNSISYL
jgi:hypothetical protein